MPPHPQPPPHALTPTASSPTASSPKPPLSVPCSVHLAMLHQLVCLHAQGRRFPTSCPQPHCQLQGTDAWSQAVATPHSLTVAFDLIPCHSPPAPGSVTPHPWLDSKLQVTLGVRVRPADQGRCSPVRTPNAECHLGSLGVPAALPAPVQTGLDHSSGAPRDQRSLENKQNPKWNQRQVHHLTQRALKTRPPVGRMSGCPVWRHASQLRAQGFCQEQEVPGGHLHPEEDALFSSSTRQPGRRKDRLGDLPPPHGDFQEVPPACQRPELNPRTHLATRVRSLVCRTASEAGAPGHGSFHPVLRMQQVTVVTAQKLLLRLPWLRLPSSPQPCSREQGPDSSRHCEAAARHFHAAGRGLVCSQQRLRLALLLAPGSGRRAQERPPCAGCMPCHQLTQEHSSSVEAIATHSHS
ncbi:uncharacterized protein LOC124963243 [Sciurus carolinensis]|uniref:uncharacterized protein LOC124963243 n=1 Tax=Sciurus carolinensis TaxID=30640 RepID=UPI001FB419F4|nr:uncharacterized protein LOC124963243 [Sciurus carolinensis]